MTMTEPGVAVGSVLRSLDEIRNGIDELHNRLEQPAPTLFRVFPLNRTHVRLRVVSWVVSGENGAVTPVTLQVGTSVVATVVLSAETPTLVIPLLVTIDRAQDVVVAGGELTDSWLIAYPE
jgi:hypothetical protein